MEALSVRILYSEEMRPNHFFVRTKMQAKVFDKVDSHLQDYFKLGPNPPVPQLHAVCFKSNTVLEGLVCHFQNYIVVA